MSDPMECGRPKCANIAKRQGLCVTHYKSAPSGYVNAQPAIQRYKLLRGCGLTVETIAKLAGLNRDTLLDMCDPHRKSVQLETRDRLMAVRVPAKIVPSRATIPATGTCRRIQALAAVGHSLGFQAKELGVTPQAMTELLRREVVWASSAAKIAELFDRLQMVPGTSVRARNHAARQGWLAPVWWDDDTIDDPTAEPDKEVHVSAADRIDELRDIGITDIRAIASRLGIQPDSVQRAIGRSAA